MSHANRNFVRSLLGFLGKCPSRSAARRPSSRLSLEGLDDRSLPSASLGGTVFHDLTGNGLSADDTAFGGVTVKLYQDTNNDGKLDTGDVQLASQLTAADGSYSFGNLGAGTYFVSENTPSGFVRTAPTTTSYITVNLATDQFVGGNNFDNYQKPNTGAITGVSFTVTDPVLGTYTVTNLRGNTHQGDTVTANFTVTGTSPALVSLVTYDAPGATFNANTASQQVIVDQQSVLESPGPHSLTVHLPDNFYQVDFVAGAPINELGPAGSNIFYTPQGRLISADNEGTQAYSPATLSGVVYNDVGGNGIYNSATDVGIAGVTVTVTGTNDLAQSVSVSVVTGLNGSYSIPGLRPGTYTITQTSPPQTGFTNESSNETFALGGTASPGQIANIVVPNGGVGGNYNLPQVQAVAAATISGVVYFDPSSTGIYNTTDAGLSGVVVVLRGTDQNGNAVNVTVTTDANGAYSFAGVLPGTYTITWGTPSTSYTTGTTNDTLPSGVASKGKISGIVVSGATNLTYNLPDYPFVG